MKKAPKNLRFAALATDVILFTIKDGELKVLLVKINVLPFYKNKWALPGGLIRPEETAMEAVVRIVKEKGGLDPEGVYLEQLYTFSGVKRDPRNRVVSVAYMGLVPEGKVKAIDDDEALWWAKVGTVPVLAYDHAEMIKVALERLRSKIEYTNIVYSLLPKEFTLSELQKVYETVLGEKLDKRNFRRKVLAVGLVVATGNQKRGEANRPAEMYRFKERQPKVVEVL